jgi:hypothetical protein
VINVNHGCHNLSLQVGLLNVSRGVESSTYESQPACMFAVLGLPASLLLELHIGMQ